jgi:hypothetical protein
MFCALLVCRPAWAACAGPPYDQFDFWLGAWHDPTAPAAEHCTVRRTAGGCAIEEVLTSAKGQTQGIGLSGWDSERQQWRQLWVDKDRIVTVCLSGPAADGSVFLTSEPKAGGMRWRCTYRNIGPNAIDANYAQRVGEDGPGPLYGRVTSIGSDQRVNNDASQLHAAACSEPSSGTNAPVV